MKWIRNLFGKSKLISTKDLAYMCCANCEEFTPIKVKLGWGFCPAIYWPYDISKIKDTSFCKDFRLANKFSRNYKVDKKSRNAKDCLIKRIHAAGLRKGPGMISDSVMLTSTTKI